MAPPARRAPNAPSPKSRKPTDKKPRTKKGVSFSAKAKRNGQSLGKKSFQNGSTMVKKKKFRAAPKKRIEDLSESDLDSDDDLGMNGPEFGLLSDSSSSSDGFDDETDVHDTLVKKAENAEDVEDDGDDSEGSDVGQEEQSVDDECVEEEIAGEEAEPNDDQAEDTQEAGAEDEESAASDGEDSSNDDGSANESSSEEIPEPEGSVEGDSSDNEEQKPKVKQSKRNMEDDSCTIFVGNLPYEVKKNKLKKWFANEIDMSRHIVCEQCHPRVSGGFDPETNQIVICQNNSKNDGIVQGILVHEMIHMFDYCGNKIDFKNIDHLACTEIRAANLTHCSLTSAILQGDASLVSFANKHKECVKSKAIMSIIAVRDVTAVEAAAAVDRVFDKCYNDMEPIGRRVKGYEDSTRAYAEGFLYGYI
ncbi:unnamed protein product [Nesidiocoris tenuis]|uniref:Mitochondrial inner membrane protease ATP23 homolog n=1 Tax=Nesidiocoris tenuis TaxID=355587 RepID=A0A6H5GEF2_9HEMI|nr:unnamed protein product [Nesidiocoris tenuis]